ncbi:MAG: CAP domain-containing protein [Clostridia bacterium]|nr:CAP domain-containing protein [Clostridia bacterium]
MTKKSIIKAISIVLALVMVLSFSACTDKKKDAKEASTTTTTKESKTTTTTKAEEEETEEEAEDTTKAPVTTAAPATTAASTTTTNSDYNNYVYKFYDQDMLNAVNAERAKVGKNALRMDSKLCIAARTRVKELITMYTTYGTYEHTRPDGSYFDTALTAAGVNWTACGENLAIRQTSISEVMTSWMNSPGHKANILSEKHDYNAMGYAWCEYQGVNYWIQEFAYIP